MEIEKPNTGYMYDSSAQNAKIGKKAESPGRDTGNEDIKHVSGSPSDLCATCLPAGALRNPHEGLPEVSIGKESLNNPQDDFPGRNSGVGGKVLQVGLGGIGVTNRHTDQQLTEIGFTLLNEVKHHAGSLRPMQPADYDHYGKRLKDLIAMAVEEGEMRGRGL